MITHLKNNIGYGKQQLLFPHIAEILSDYKVIKDFPNYGISRDGEVISLRFNRKLKPRKSKNGYFSVGLSKDCKPKNVTIHRLIAVYYIDNVNNYPQVNHINGIKTDNRVENLEWCTASQNLKHAFINKLRSNNTGENHPTSKLKELQVLEIRNSILSKKELSILYNVSYSTIRQIIKRRIWKHI
jgi:hypothetical protein